MCLCVLSWHPRVYYNRRVCCCDTKQERVLFQGISKSVQQWPPNAGPPPKKTNFVSCSCSGGRKRLWLSDFWRSRRKERAMRRGVRLRNCWTIFRRTSWRCYWPRSGAGARSPQNAYFCSGRLNRTCYVARHSIGLTSGRAKSLGNYPFAGPPAILCMSVAIPGIGVGYVNPVSGTKLHITLINTTYISHNSFTNRHTLNTLNIGIYPKSISCYNRWLLVSTISLPHQPSYDVDTPLVYVQNLVLLYLDKWYLLSLPVVFIIERQTNSYTNKKQFVFILKVYL